jgi:endonuclease III
VNAAKRREIFARLAAANPHPTTELEYRTPFELLIAVILSAQSTDKSVNSATRRLYAVAHTPQQLLALGVTGLADYVKTLGFWRAKSRNIIATCRLLLEQHGGEVPRERALLEALPGVGRKTANVVLNTVFGELTLAVDTHVFRVANRTRLASGRTPRAVEEALLANTPPEYLRHAHHWLLLHGRYVCKARRPECPRCILRDLCEYRPKTRAAPDVRKRRP